jgi:hypothetical protein
MKISDFVWFFILILISTLIIFPETNLYFNNYTENYPYLMGFLKTAILASMGELVVNRMIHKSYFYGHGHILKFIVWGFLGMIFVMVFKLFYEGVLVLQNTHLLFSFEEGFLNKLSTAFLASLLMNLIFAPSFMILHRLTDGYIDLSLGKLKNFKDIKIEHVIENIDWTFFFKFVCFKTIPIFWIPAHTVTFLLPPNYRVLMAAYLSIVLGFILTYAKIKQKTSHKIES